LGKPNGKQVRIYPDRSKRIYYFKNGIRAFGYKTITPYGKKGYVLEVPAF